MSFSQKYSVIGVRADGTREVRAINLSAGIAEALQAGDCEAGFFVRILIERDEQSDGAGESELF